MTEMLTVISLIFIAAGPFVLLANRFRIPTVPLLIAAGVAIGGFVDEQLTLELARYGIALLVFVFGARIPFDAVRVVLQDSELVAFGQILVIGFAGLVLGVILGIPLDQAVFVGIAAAFSSTIVASANIHANIRNNLVRGRLAQSIHYVQDIVAIAIVLIIGAEAFTIEGIAVELGAGVILLLLAALVYRYLFTRLEAITDGSDEPMLIAIIGLLVAFMWAAEFLAVSIVVGAFAAGLAVHHDPVEHLGIFNGLESIKDFFAAIFFVTVGALITFPSSEVLLIALFIIVLTAIVKPMVTIALLIYRGYEARSATLTSINLDQVSEFSLIIAIEALFLGLLFPTMFEAIILAAAVTMVTSTFTQDREEAIYRTLADSGLIVGQHDMIDRHSNVPAGLSDHVIVVGYGRQGQHLTRYLEDLGRRYVIIENDPGLLGTVQTDCEACVFGDAMERYTWEKASVQQAELVISTVESVPVTHRILSIHPEPDVIVRATDSEQVEGFLARGARYVYVNDTLAGRQLIEYIEAIENEELSREELRERHRGELDQSQRRISGVRFLHG